MYRDFHSGPHIKYVPLLLLCDNTRFIEKKEESEKKKKKEEEDDDDDDRREECKSNKWRDNG